MPSILTKGPETPNGGTFIVLDPHRTYIPDNGEPGVRIPTLDIIEKLYPDMYSAHLQNDESLTAEKGTWFRFPLRTQTMAERSKIKREETSVTSIEDSFLELEQHFENSLLFLVHVREIQVSIIEKDGSIKQCFEMKSSIHDDALQDLDKFLKHIKLTMERLGKKDIVFSNIGYEQVEYDLMIQNARKGKQVWKVVQNFNSPNPIPEEIQNAVLNKSIRLSPRGGVAFPMTSMDLEEKGCCAFCFLPLAMERTGLPVHVNGHFVLHSSRSSIWEDELPEIKRTTSGLWNEHMLNSIIPYSYVVLLSSLVKEVKDTTSHISVNSFYAIFPSFSQCTSDQWKTICRGVFQMLIDLETPIMPVASFSKKHNLSNVRFVSLYKNNSCPVFFNDLFDQMAVRRATTKWDTGQSESRTIDHNSVLQDANTLACALRDVGMKLTDVPPWIYCSLQESKCTANGILYVPELVSPQAVINFLKTWSSTTDDKCTIAAVGVNVTDSVLTSALKVNHLLEYCLWNGQNTELIEGLPLLVNELNELNIFSKENKVIVSEYYHLLPASKHRFLHRLLVSCMLKHIRKSQPSDLLESLTLEKFAELLSHSLDQQQVRTSPIILDTEGIGILTEKWVHNVWKFLVSQMQPSAEEAIASLCKHLLHGWALIPARCPRTNKMILYSFEHGYAVLDTISFIASDGTRRHTS